VKLRQGVKFHDGTPFEAEDVAFSYARVPTVPGAMAPFTPNTRDIKSIEVVAPDTIRFRTALPDPLFAYKLCQVCMLSRKIHAGATPADFNSGKVAIGTGPYKVVAFTVGEKLELTANPTYWGGAPAWQRVTTRYIVDPGARIAALRAGEVDLIDNVPVQDIDSLSRDKSIELFNSPAFLMVYIALDSERDESPFMFDLNGEPLKKNPLKDVRVRKALMLAIDRNSIVNRLLAGQGTIADQFVGLPVVDRVAGMTPLKTDLAEAKKLLKEAGYPDGFKMKLQGSTGWFASDDKILQAVAQGFSRIGIRTDVEVLPTATLQTRMKEHAFTAMIAGFNSPFALITMRNMAMTRSKQTGYGSSNWGHYSNPKLDELMTQALKEMNPEKRKSLTDESMRLFLADVGAVPILYTKPNWAGRRGKVKFSGNPMSRTSAFYAQPV
jgi:peptide/nickel transport system substrate-binding protein